jgi:N-acetylglucosaminyl-diphospho-decaprenol L-rhamnosyltransferase
VNAGQIRRHLGLSIDVIIPTFDNWGLTERCLRHLAAQTVDHSLIVVDNGSSDGTPEKVRSTSSGARVMELGANLGFAAACNRGAAAGTGEVIVLLNNDVEARPDLLERLVRPFERDDRAGSVAAVLVQRDETTIDSVGLTVDRTLAGFPRLRGRPVTEAASQSPVLAGPAGGAGGYRRTAWESVGGLDEGVRFYGEDVDLALRIRAAGWETAVAPEAVGVHLGSATAGHRSAWQRYQGGFSRGYFLRRYRVLSSRAAGRALFTEGIVVVGDALLNGDLSALRGRLTGWRSARGAEPTPIPPPAAIDPDIGFSESLRLRRVVYAGSSS